MLDEPLIDETAKIEEINIWWKEKRLLYNLVVGGFGILVVWIEVVLLNRSVFRMLPPIIAFGFFANFSYYLGSFVEILFYREYPDYHSNYFGKSLFWMGVIFSVLGMVSMEVAILMRANVL